MNVNTGEIVEGALADLVKEMTGKEKEQWVEISDGERIDIKGCPCVVSHINPSKRRITLTTVGKVLAPDHGFNSERSQRAENGVRP